MELGDVFDGNGYTCVVAAGSDASPPWWSVDLPAAHIVSQVEVTNSADSAYYKLMNTGFGDGFSIYVSGQDAAEYFSTGSTKCAGPLSLDRGGRCRFSCGVYGDKLWIVGGQARLSICEVSVSWWPARLV